MYWLWLSCLCHYVLANHDDASTDLMVIAELAKTSEDWVILTTGNKISIETHLPMLLSSAKLAVGGRFDQHIVVVNFLCVIATTCIVLRRFLPLQHAGDILPQCAQHLPAPSSVVCARPRQTRPPSIHEP